MDTYYTIEEKYLQAVDELIYGETPKSLHLLNDIIQADPTYARAHYQLGLIYYYDIQDYQTAGYHLKQCIELEASFPDVYLPYLDLLVFLNMENAIAAVSKKALLVPGVDHAGIYNLLGLFAEKNSNWQKAAEWYRKALLAASEKKQVAEMEEHLERIALKIKSTRQYVYNLEE